MAAGRSAEPSSGRRAALRHWRLKVLAAIGAAVLLGLLLRGRYRHEIYHLTGPAAWMWVDDDVSEPRPTAGTFVRAFDLPSRPRRAVAKVCGDRQYALWINSFLVLTGHNRPGFVLDMVPVTDLLRPGRNVVAIEAASPTSVGAVLFALDLEPAPGERRSPGPWGRNAVVSGGNWTVTARWSRALLEHGPGAAVGGRPPWIWGTPPDHPWSYPVPRLHARPLVQAMAGDRTPVPPSRAERLDGGAWRYLLGERFHGLVWLVLAGRRPEGWTVRSDPPGRGGLDRPVAVVPVPGRNRWLVPAVVEGPAIVVEGPHRPPALETVPVLAGP